jgi:hypothetical protein
MTRAPPLLLKSLQTRLRAARLFLDRTYRALSDMAKTLGTSRAGAHSRHGAHILARGVRFSGSHLRWPVERSARTFTVRVVEPKQYAPATHGDLFNAVMTELISPEPSRIDPLERLPVQASPERFDLITFPEAFVAVDALLGALAALTGFGPTGCIHVGLRSSDDLGATFSRWPSW